RARAVPARASAGAAAAMAEGQARAAGCASPRAWERSAWPALNGSHGVIRSSIGTMEASCSINSIHVIGTATAAATDRVMTAIDAAIDDQMSTIARYSTR